VYCKDANRRGNSEHTSFDYPATPSGNALLSGRGATSVASRPP
jgi:hypothetical protein